MDKTVAFITFLLAFGGSFADNSANGDNCVLRYNYQHAGIFVTQANSGGPVIITTPEGKIPLADGDSIQGFCSTTFTNLGEEAYDGMFTNITFTCSNGHIFYSPPPYYSPVGLDSSEMNCRDEVRFYQKPVPFCSATGLQYGFNVMSTPISLAEICYVAESSQIMFIHYVVGNRPDTVEDQTNYNPSNISSIANSTVVNFDSSTISQRVATLRASIITEITQFADDVIYEFASLVELRYYSGIFGPFTNNFVYSDLIPWWTPLRRGNWRAVLAAIQNLGSSGVYDVYMGVSSNVSSPISEDSQNFAVLTYLDGKIEKTVPKYVWSYVKERNSEDKGVVIIGVNTPFFDENAKNAFLCDDVCHNSDWLASILPTSHMPALGYVYCCHPDDVANLLDGFPQINQ